MDVPVLGEEITLPAPLPDVFETFLGWPDAVFLDSSLVDPHLGRYSYVAANPFLTLQSENGRTAVRASDSRWPSSGGEENLPAMAQGAAGDPFAELQRLLRAYRTERLPWLPPFQGGAIGYFAYDLGRHLEVLPCNAVDDLGLPDLYVGLYAWVLAHDHLENRTWLIVNAVDGDLAAAEALLWRLRQRVAAARRGRATPDWPLCRLMTSEEASGRGRGMNSRRVAEHWREQYPDGLRQPREPRSNFTRECYLRAIAAAKAHIAAGDIYEVCLSQRFAVEIEEHPWQLYRRLRDVSPVPYGAYLGFPKMAVVSASPELFLRVESGRVETRPIKGTRPRGATAELDRRLAAELRASEKEQAENLMIVDLLRNDLGRVCRIGSVHVPEVFGVESYSTVHQMVSTVRGELRPELDAVDLLRACFPGGSVTGCPKIRAMEIIDELEPTRRGIYCGAIGFLGFDGEMDTSIVIRTIVVKDNRAYFQVGGAIVADSDPAAEYQETLDKARAALLALGANRDEER